MQWYEVLALVGVGNVILEIVKGLIQRKRSVAETELTDVQADDQRVQTADRLVKMLWERVDRIDKEHSSLLREVGIIRRNLYLADKALFYLVRHDGIATQFPQEVDYAVKIRRGEVDDSDITPMMGHDHSP